MKNDLFINLCIYLDILFIKISEFERVPVYCVQNIEQQPALLGLLMSVLKFLKDSTIKTSTNFLLRYIT